MGSINQCLSGRLARLFSTKYDFDHNIPSSVERKKMNLFTAINNAMDIVLGSDKT